MRSWCTRSRDAPETREARTRLRPMMKFGEIRWINHWRLLSLAYRIKRFKLRFDQFHRTMCAILYRVYINLYVRSFLLFFSDRRSFNNIIFSKVYLGIKKRWINSLERYAEKNITRDFHSSIPIIRMRSVLAASILIHPTDGKQQPPRRS